MVKLTYNVNEVAQILGVSKSAVYNMCRKKTIPCKVVGTRRYVIPIEAFKEWLNEGVMVL